MLSRGMALKSAIAKLISGGAGSAILLSAGLSFAGGSWAGWKARTLIFEAAELKIQKLEHAQALTDLRGERDALQSQIDVQADIDAEADEERAEQNEEFTKAKSQMQGKINSLQNQLRKKDGKFYDQPIPDDAVMLFNCAFHGIMCDESPAGGAEDNHDDGNAESGYR